MVNTKELNGSLSPEESEEPDARVRGTLESGEEDGEVQPVPSASHLHLVATLGWLATPPVPA